MAILSKLNIFTKSLNFWLVILLIVVFPLGELLRIDLGNAVAFTLNDLVVLAISLVYLINLIRKRRITGSLSIPIALFFATALLSLAVNITKLSNIEFLVSLSYAIRWLFYSTVYLTIVEFNKSQKNKVLNLLTIVGIICVGFGFLQLLLYPNLRNLFYAGWDEHLYRIFSGFLDPNFSGIIFVLTLVLILTRNYLKDKLKWTVSALVFLGVVLTFSRTAIIALLTSLTAISFMDRNKNIALATVIAIIFIASFFIFIPKKESTNVFRTASTFSRATNYKQGLTIFSYNPILGVGFNAYRYALSRYGFKDKAIYGPSHGASGNDNSFIFVMATSGIIGLLAYLYLIYKMFKIKGNGKVLRIASLLVAIVGGFFINGLFFVFILEWIWIVLASTENT